MKLLIFILVCNLGLNTSYAQSSLSAPEHIFKLNQKHPIQFFLEKEAGIPFDLFNYLPAKRISLYKERNISPRNISFEKDLNYFFFLDKFERTLLINLQLPPNKNSEEILSKNNFQIELIYPDQTSKIYHNLSELILFDFPAGEYQIIIHHSDFDYFDIKINSAAINVPLSGGRIFISPDDTYSAEEIKTISRLINEKSFDLFIVSNNSLANEFGLNFSPSVIQEKSDNKAKNNNSLFPQGDSVEFIQNNTQNSNLIEMLRLSEGVLIYKKLIPLPQGGYNKINFISYDLFRTEKEQILKIINKIFIHDLPEEQESIFVFLNYKILKIAIFLLILFIVSLVFGKNIISFIQKENKIQFIKKLIKEKNQSLRQFFLRFFFSIAISLFFLVIIAGLFIYLFYYWYINYSGLDLIPDFKISDFLLKIGFIQKLDFIYSLIAIVFSLFFIFLCWLFADRIKFGWDFLFSLASQIQKKLPLKVKIIIFYAFSFSGFLFLLTFFLKLPGTFLFLFIFVITALIFLIFHFAEKQIVLFPGHINIKFFKPIQYLIFSVPVIIFLVKFLPYCYWNIIPSQGLNLGFIHLPSFQQEISLNSQIASIGVDSVSKDSAQDTATVYRIINKFPVLIKTDISPVKNKINNQKIEISLQAKLKTDSNLWIASAVDDAPDSKSLTPLYFPSLNQFDLIKHYENFSLYQKNKTSSIIASSAPLEEFINKNFSQNSIIGLSNNFNPFFYNKDYQINFSQFFKKNLPEFTEGSSEFFFQLQSQSLTFFTYLKNNLDLEVDLQTLQKSLPKEKYFYLLLKNNQGETIDSLFITIPIENTGPIDKIYPQKWQIGNLPEGIYQIFINDYDQEQEDYILRRIKINSNKLVFNSAKILSQGQNILYFANLSNGIKFTSHYETNLDFYDFKGELTALNNSNFPANPSLKDLKIDPNTLWKITLPNLSSYLESEYNLYAFSPESWFYPYEFYFTELNPAMNSAIVPHYEKPVLENNFADITFKLPEDFLQNLPKIAFSLSTSDKEKSPLIFTEWLKLIINKKK